MMTPAQHFKEHKYVLVENFLTDREANFLYNYVKNHAIVSATIWETYGLEVLDRSPKMLGFFDDPQAPGDFSKYGDIIFDTLLEQRLKDVETITGIDLIPTYTYHRLYTQGSELKRHKDRPSCEISATLCLGFDKGKEEETWPMFINEKPIHMNPGDFVIYRGCEVEHWREPYKGINHAQVFLHYNEKGGQYNNLYDTRAHLGLPQEFRTKHED